MFPTKASHVYIFGCASSTVSMATTLAAVEAQKQLQIKCQQTGKGGFPKNLYLRLSMYPGGRAVI